MTAVLNNILDQVDYRTQSEYNDKGCTHFIELSSIACNKIPCLFYAIDLEREKDKETIKAVIHSICHQIDAFSSEYEQSISGKENLIYREVGSSGFECGSSSRENQPEGLVCCFPVLFGQTHTPRCNQSHIVPLSYVDL